MVMYFIKALACLLVLVTKVNSMECGGFDSQKVLQKFDGKLNHFISQGNKEKENYVYSGYGLLSVIKSMADMLETANQKTVRKALGVRNSSGMCPPIPKEKNTDFGEATRIWIDESVKLDEHFLEHARDKIKTLAMTKNADEVTKIINSWVAEHTMDMIKDLLKPAVISDDTRLVVTNALAFHGKWKFPFKPEHTEPRDFKLNTNEKIKVQTMATTMKTRHHKDPEHGDIAELPYAGGRYSMFIVLPPLHGAKKSFTTERIEDVISNKMKRHVNLQIFLPKFKLTSEYELHSLLSKMGLQSLFTHCDVIKEPRDVSFADVIHKVSMEVNEEGTKASAGSAGVTSRSFPLRFEVNEPFEFMIRDLVKHKTIFHGKVLKPEY